MKTTQTTDMMRLEQIFLGEPASVLLSERTGDIQGQCRSFQQRVLVQDSILLDRLIAEAQIGANIEATLVTEWRASSSVVRLTDFQVIPASASVLQQRVA